MAMRRKSLSVTRISLVVSLVIGAATLGSCFFVEVRGPVVGAVVNLSEWNYRYEERKRLGITQKTLGPAQLENELGTETWRGLPARRQLAFMGGTEPPDDVSIRPKRLYVLSSGPTCTEAECLIKGSDYDPHGNQELTDTPLTVDGTLFAFTTGEQILEQSVRLSVLTTALYHYAKNFVSDKLILDELNAIAPMLVSDIDKNGMVDYSDILEWSRQRHQKHYLGDIDDIDTLAEKIRDRDSYYFRKSWIDVVGSDGAAKVLGQDYVGNSDGVDGYKGADAEIFGTDGVPSPHIQDKALWLGERVTDLKIYSIEWWGYYKDKDLREETKSFLFRLDVYTGHDSGVPHSRLFRKKVKAHVAPNPSYPYREVRVISDYNDYNGRLLYRYNAVLGEPLLIPRNARWLGIAQLKSDSDVSNPNFVLLSSREGDAKVSFSTQYGWMTPSYNSPRRASVKGYLRLIGIEVE